MPASYAVRWRRRVTRSSSCRWATRSCSRSTSAASSSPCRDSARHSQVGRRWVHRADSLRGVVQEQGRAGVARCGDRLSARAGRRQADEGPAAPMRPSRRPPADETPFSRSPSRSRPTRSSKLTYIQVYSRCARAGRTPATRRRTSASASAVCCRCMPTSARRFRKFALATSRRRSGFGTRGRATRSPTRTIILEAMKFPAPVIDIREIEPKTKADQDKLAIALKLAEEDPNVRVHSDQETSRTIISGMVAPTSRSSSTACN